MAKTRGGRGERERKGEIRVGNRQCVGLAEVDEKNNNNKIVAGGRNQRSMWKGQM